MLKIRPRIVKKLDGLPTAALGRIRNYLAVATSA